MGAYIKKFTADKTEVKTNETVNFSVKIDTDNVSETAYNPYELCVYVNDEYQVSLGTFCVPKELDFSFSETFSQTGTYNVRVDLLKGDKFDFSYDYIYHSPSDKELYVKFSVKINSIPNWVKKHKGNWYLLYFETWFDGNFDFWVTDDYWPCGLWIENKEGSLKCRWAMIPTIDYLGKKTIYLGEKEFSISEGDWVTYELDIFDKKEGYDTGYVLVAFSKGGTRDPEGDNFYVVGTDDYAYTDIVGGASKMEIIAKGYCPNGKPLAYYGSKEESI